MAREVRIEAREQVALLTLVNSEKRNALDPDLCGELAQTVTELSGTGVRAAVLTGDGDRAFCSGFDVNAFPDDGEAARLAAETFERMIDAVSAAPVPIIAALNGSAIGGGCGLAVTCDMRIAHDEVTLSMPPARLGIIYDLRGLARFVALVGESRAREIFYTARSIPAVEAQDWGLIDYVVDRTEVLSRALAIARTIASMAPLSVQGTRRAFEALLARRCELDAEVLAELERARFASWSSEDAREARRALAAKRKPSFDGR